MGLGMQFISRTQGPAIQSKNVSCWENLKIWFKKEKKTKKKPYTQKTNIKVRSWTQCLKTNDWSKMWLTWPTSANRIRRIIFCLKHFTILKNKE